MQEFGLRNQAHGADKFGFDGLAAVHWNLTEPALYEHAIGAGEASLVVGGALCAATGHHTGRSPKDKHTVVDALTENSVWWEANRKMSKENFDNLLADFRAHAKGQQAVRAGSLRRRRSEIPHQDARVHRIRLALAVHPAIADPAGARRARRIRSRTHRRRHALVQAGRQAARRARRLRHHGGDRFHAARSC